MELEVAVSYLLALAVPAWLVGEYVVHTWKTSRRSAVDGRPESCRPGPHRELPPNPRGLGAGRLADSRRPA